LWRLCGWGHGIRAVAGITLAATISFSLLLALVDGALGGPRSGRLDWRQARWSRLRELFRYGSLCVIYQHRGHPCRFLHTDSIVIARILGAALITARSNVRWPD